MQAARSETPAVRWPPACRRRAFMGLVGCCACRAGAYLLGVMPPELIQLLGLNIPLLRRDPHYFLPTTGESASSLGGAGLLRRGQA